MDRLTSMQLFAKSVELGSFSAAAQALNTSSQFVGKHVRSLELHLGVKLLHRTTRQQRLTEAGEAFYERVKVILSEIEAAEDAAALTNTRPRGQLRINAPVTFGAHALARRLPEYLAEYPEVSVELSLANHTVDLINEGFDVVFRVGELADSGLVARTLAPYRMLLCASASYLASHTQISQPEDLSLHECLGFSHTALRKRWQFESTSGAVEVETAGRLVSDNGEALLAAARAGMGLLLQPEELVRDDLNSGRLTEVLPQYSVPTRELHLLYAPDRKPPPKLRSFVEFAVRAFGKSIC